MISWVNEGSASAEQAASAAGLYAQFAQDGFHQAPAGEGALQQIGPDKRRECQPPRADKHRATGHPQRQ